MLELVFKAGLSWSDRKGWQGGETAIASVDKDGSHGNGAEETFLQSMERDAEDEVWSGLKRRSREGVLGMVLIMEKRTGLILNALSVKWQRANVG